ncbi:MAG: hypothetical protein QW146_09140 [Candidatus Bathyarchaeia archaeon]
MLFLLLGHISLSAYAEAAPLIEVKTERHFNDSWVGNVKGQPLRIRANFKMERIDTLSLFGAPRFTQLKADGWVEVNGELVPFKFNTTKYPIYKIYNVFNRKSSMAFDPLSNPVRYSWFGVTFISTRSSPLHVEYDHPDNGPYQPPTYNIPPDEASPTALTGISGRYHLHIPVWIINDIKNSGTLTSLAGATASLIGFLLALPEPVISKIVGLFLSAAGGVLAILGLLRRAFAESVLQTELGDGWTWVWGQGKFVTWFIEVYWWWQSFGRWRDWGWFFWSFISEPPPHGGGSGWGYRKPFTPL